MRVKKYITPFKVITVIFLILVSSVVKILPLQSLPHSPPHEQQLWGIPNFSAVLATEGPPTIARVTQTELDYPKNPQMILLLDPTTGIIQLTRGAKSKNLRILIHMVSCRFDKTEFLEINDHNGNVAKWTCASENQTDEFRPPLEFLDNLTTVSIIPHFKNNPAMYSVAEIVVNLYKDLDLNTGNFCPENWQSCNVYYYKNDCPRTCRSRVTKFTDVSCENHQCRCIPKRLTCNGLPNCGAHHFEEDSHLCEPMKTCDCGTLGVTTIVAICSGWMVLIGVSMGVYLCVRNSANLLATVDIGVTVGLLILWNVALGTFTVKDSRVSTIFGTILLFMHLFFAIWLYIGTRQTQQLTTAFTFSLIYLFANVLLLLVSLILLIIYFGFTADLDTHEDSRLWISGFACGCRLPGLFSILHYIKRIHKRAAIATT